MKSYLKVILFFLFFFFLHVAKGENRSDSLVTLRNSYIEVTVSRCFGGRLVGVSAPDGTNMLKVSDDIWTQQKKRPIPADAEMDFVGYDGMITWLGPQSDWWAWQNVNQKRKMERSIWPPDPYLIYSHFRITELTDSSVALSGPHSPVSGITMQKVFSIHENRLCIDIEIENTSDSLVAWDIWTNSRFCVSSRFLVAGVEEETLELKNNPANGARDVPYVLQDGYFSFTPPDNVPADSAGYLTKAFMHTSEGRIAAFKDDFMLIMAFEAEKKENIHPEQALVEAYMRVSSDSTQNLLELEHHSAYRELQPGDKMKQEQSWFLLPFSREHDIDGMIEGFENGKLEF